MILKLLIGFVMDDFIEKYKHIWDYEPMTLMEKYSYQNELTEKLDQLEPEDFGQEALNEIVLWKVNRYAEMEFSLIEKIRELSSLNNGEHREGRVKDILHALLKTKGIQLPMASSILRFINPKVFQIIDDRVFRIVMSDRKKYRAKPKKVTKGYLDDTTGIYVEYLDRLNKISSEKMPFHLLDRILYQLDIELNNKLGDKY